MQQCPRGAFKHQNNQNSDTPRSLFSVIWSPFFPHQHQKSSICLKFFEEVHIYEKRFVNEKLHSSSSRRSSWVTESDRLCLHVHYGEESTSKPHQRFLHTEYVTRPSVMG